MKRVETHLTRCLPLTLFVALSSGCHDSGDLSSGPVAPATAPASSPPPKNATPEVANTQETKCYARCNLKVLEGNEITWINWQAAPTFIPAGTALNLYTSGSTTTLVNPKSGTTYKLDVGANGDAFVKKFVCSDPLDVGKFSQEVQGNIASAVARNGMTKEEVYVAMGPPTEIAGAKTNNFTYDDIMRGNLWVYARRRFGKNIGVEFDAAAGRVIRTEGIWK